MKRKFVYSIIAAIFCAIAVLSQSACSDDNNSGSVSSGDAISTTDVVSIADTEPVPPEHSEPVYAREGLSLRVGDIVLFGSYEQDNDETTQDEPIEWIVLAVDDNEALLISKYCLDCQPFNKSYGEVGWEFSYLRKWLNGSFFDTAFTEAEQERIVLSEVASEKNSIYGTKTGRDTQDRVFILGVSEARTYFATDEERMTTATEFARSKKGYIEPEHDGCWWWLRTVGFRNEYVTNVRYDGLVGETGQGVDAPDHCVRPVIRISL